MHIGNTLYKSNTEGKRVRGRFFFSALKRGHASAVIDFKIVMLLFLFNQSKTKLKPTSHF